MDNELPRPKFLTVPEAAKLCGVTRNTVFNWVQKGRLKAYQTPGRTNLIRPLDLLLFMEQSGMFVPSELADLAKQDATLKAANGQAAPHVFTDMRPKILIVDDEPVIRNVISRLLRKIAPVYEAETGYEALHMLTMHKDIHIVLLDLHMPGLHGVETLKQIKTSRPDVKVAVVTGYDGEIPEEMLKNGTIAHLIRKPFDMSEIQELVSRLLEQAHV